MLCISLWRYREYPVDKSAMMVTGSASKGFQSVDFGCRKSRAIKKYDYVKKFIDFFNPARVADRKGGLAGDL
jgi:hypothetical protein